MKYLIIFYLFLFQFALTAQPVHNLEDNGDELDGVIIGGNNITGKEKEKGVNFKFLLRKNTQLLKNGKVVLNSGFKKKIPEGLPLNFKLTGENFTITVRYTCFEIDPETVYLIIHSESILSSDGNNMDIYKNIKTIRVPYNNPLYYYPLGRSNQYENSGSILRIELIIIKLNDND